MGHWGATGVIHNGEGIDYLLQMIMDIFFGEIKEYELLLKPEDGKIRALLYQKDSVISESTDEQGQSLIVVSLSKKDYQEISHLLIK